MTRAEVEQLLANQRKARARSHVQVFEPVSPLETNPDAEARFERLLMTQAASERPGARLDGGFPDYGDDPLHEARCNACGHEFYEANISTATHPEAIKAAEVLAAVIDDHHAGEVAAFNRGDQS